MRIILDTTKTVAQNAAIYFEKGKKAKRKITGAKQACEKALKGLEKVAKTKKKEVIKIKRKNEWYEKFRWFYSSDNILCIGGRDATTNDILVKKHIEKDDLIFHTEIAGSPFFIVKGNNKNTIQEAAIATASFSRAWKNKIATTDVYYIKPDQIKKELGLPKGTFMIYGKRNYLKPVIELAIGLYQNKAMCGPTESIKKHCKNYLIIKQGYTKKSDIAKKVRYFIKEKENIEIPLDEIMQALPPGDCDISKKKPF